LFHFYKKRKNMIKNIEGISDAERKIAQFFIEKLTDYVGEIDKSGDSSIRIHSEDSSEVLHIPNEFFYSLKSVLHGISEGKTVTVEPYDEEVSIERAGEILMFSDAHVEKLLDSGEVPYRETDSGEKLIKMNEVLKYKEKYKPIRRRNLEILVEEAQKLNLGY